MGKGEIRFGGNGFSELKFVWPYPIYGLVGLGLGFACMDLLFLVQLKGLAVLLTVLNEQSQLIGGLIC